MRILPVPFSLNKLWYDLYCSEFATYYSDNGKDPSEGNWAFKTDAEGNPIVGDAMRGIPPKFKEVKNVGGDTEKINYVPGGLNIRNQLENLGAKLRIPRFDFYLRPGEWTPDLDGRSNNNLQTLIQSWVGTDRPITILDLSGVPSSIINDIVGILLRIVYDCLFWARNLSQGGRERPLLIVLEEAHGYLNASNDRASRIAKRIVKEGRKYGIGAMIVSQRPSEIDPTVLSQCGTFFALRLTSSTDRGRIAAAVSESLDSLTSLLPISRTGEAITLAKP